jgi:hypothetical protein
VAEVQLTIAAAPGAPRFVYDDATHPAIDSEPVPPWGKAIDPKAPTGVRDRRAHVSAATPHLWLLALAPNGEDTDTCDRLPFGPDGGPFDRDDLVSRGSHRRRGGSGTRSRGKPVPTRVVAGSRSQSIG